MNGFTIQVIQGITVAAHHLGQHMGRQACACHLLQDEVQEGCRVCPCCLPCTGKRENLHFVHILPMGSRSTGSLSSLALCSPLETGGEIWKWPSLLLLRLSGSLEQMGMERRRLILLFHSSHCLLILMDCTDYLSMEASNMSLSPWRCCHTAPNRLLNPFKASWSP